MRVLMSDAQARYLAQYLNDRYEAWRIERKKAGDRHSISAFAEWLGIKQNTLSDHMSLDSSKPPKRDIPGWILLRFYEKLGADVMAAFAADIDATEDKDEGAGA